MVLIGSAAPKLIGTAGACGANRCCEIIGAEKDHREVGKTA
jgi:hypothetical protein